MDIFCSPNVYRTPTESLQAFQWFNEIGEWEKHFSAWERFVVVYIGSAAMWIIGKRLKKRHGLKPGNILTAIGHPSQKLVALFLHCAFFMQIVNIFSNCIHTDVRQSLYDETNVWLKAIKARGGKYLGGQNPNLADLAVFGALSAIEGCEAFSDLCANTKIKTWYDLVKQSVKSSEGQGLLVNKQSI